MCHILQLDDVGWYWACIVLLLRLCTEGLPIVMEKRGGYNNGSFFEEHRYKHFVIKRTPKTRLIINIIKCQPHADDLKRSSTTHLISTHHHCKSTSLMYTSVNGTRHYGHYARRIVSTSIRPSHSSTSSPTPSRRPRMSHQPLSGSSEAGSNRRWSLSTKVAHRSSNVKRPQPHIKHLGYRFTEATNNQTLQGTTLSTTQEDCEEVPTSPPLHQGTSTLLG